MLTRSTISSIDLSVSRSSLRKIYHLHQTWGSVSAFKWKYDNIICVKRIDRVAEGLRNITAVFWPVLKRFCLKWGVAEQGWSSFLKSWNTVWLWEECYGFRLEPLQLLRPYAVGVILISAVITKYHTPQYHLRKDTSLSSLSGVCVSVLFCQVLGVSSGVCVCVCVCERERENTFRSSYGCLPGFRLRWSTNSPPCESHPVAGLIVLTLAWTHCNLSLRSLNS